MDIVAKGGSVHPLSRQVNKAEGDMLVSALRVLLADVVTVYYTAQGFHWNVKGPDFAQYHALFSSIYEDTGDSIDPIAENILKLGANAPFRLTDFIALRTVQDVSAMDSPQAMATALLQQNEALLQTINRAFVVAIAADEQGIADFLAGRDDMHKKWSWQLRVSIGQQ